MHEAVGGERPQKDTSRQRMIGGLHDTGEQSSGGVGKPAHLYRR